MKVCFLISLSVSVAINDYCRDQDKRCHDWAEMGECLGNPDYMLIACKESCQGLEGIEKAKFFEMSNNSRIK